MACVRSCCVVEICSAEIGRACREVYCEHGGRKAAGWAWTHVTDRPGIIKERVRLGLVCNTGARAKRGAKTVEPMLVAS